MREVLRGALLSVLFFAVLVLCALPAAAQGGTSPDGSTTCDDNGNCATNGGTVNAGQGNSGTPGTFNPTAPGSGSGYGNLGMGVGPDVPTDGWTPPLCIGSAGPCADNQIEDLAELVDETCALAKEASLLGVALGGSSGAAAGFSARIRGFFRSLWNRIGAQAGGKVLGAGGLVEATGALCALGGK